MSDYRKQQNKWNILIAILSFLFGLLAFMQIFSLRIYQYQSMISSVEEGQSDMFPSVIALGSSVKMVTLGLVAIGIIFGAWYEKTGHKKWNKLSYFGVFLGFLAVLNAFIPFPLLWFS